MVEGVGASSGIAMGKAFVLPAWEWELPDNLRDTVTVDESYEFERLYEGIRTSKSELEQIKQDIEELIGRDQAYIFDAHLAILDDPIFMNEIQTIIQRQSKPAEKAVKEVIEKFVGMFDLLDDEYMKERALDIKDVGNRLLKHLLGAFEEPLPPLDQQYILVAKEVSPSQMAHLERSQLQGIVTMMGGTTSHTAIMARAMGIPLVMGFDGKLNRPIQNGDILIVDGDGGLVFINPNETILEKYRAMKQKWEARRIALQNIAGLPSETKDGYEVRLDANISSLKELDQALKNGAGGVGLFRTEFLYMDRSNLPDEEEQFAVYREAAEKLGDKHLVIRTLDIGGEKQLDYFSLPKEDNPVLGYRAIRILFDQVDLFKTQLKAILRASRYGKVKILYPMISSLEEIRKAHSILKEVKRELDTDGKEYDRNIEVGIMIEVPAAAVISDQLAQEVNFFSIGTNDLVQYLIAVDRMNEQIAHMYNPYQPSVLRMLRYTIESAKAAGIPVTVCGELAGDPRALPVWLGLGIEELSMSAHSILTVKDRLLNSDAKSCIRLLPQVLSCRTSEEIVTLLDSVKCKSL